MSTILKALRRLEHERNTRISRLLSEEVADDADADVERPRRRLWPSLIGAIAAGLALGAAVLFFWPDLVLSPTEPSDSETAAQPTSPQPPPAATSVQRPAPPRPRAARSEAAPPVPSAARPPAATAVAGTGAVPEAPDAGGPVETTAAVPTAGAAAETTIAVPERPAVGPRVGGLSDEALASPVEVVERIEPPTRRPAVAPPPRDEPVPAPAPAEPAAPPGEREIREVLAGKPPSGVRPEAPPPQRASGATARVRAELPAIVVERTEWHPLPERRLAVVTLEGHSEPLTLREGDAVGPFIVGAIEPSGVLFRHEGIELRRRVGARP